MKLRYYPDKNIKVAANFTGGYDWISRSAKGEDVILPLVSILAGSEIYSKLNTQTNTKIQQIISNAVKNSFSVDDNSLKILNNIDFVHEIDDIILAILKDPINKLIENPEKLSEFLDSSSKSLEATMIQYFIEIYEKHLKKQMETPLPRPPLPRPPLPRPPPIPQNKETQPQESKQAPITKTETAPVPKNESPQPSSNIVEVDINEALSESRKYLDKAIKDWKTAHIAYSHAIEMAYRKNDEEAAKYLKIAVDLIEGMINIKIKTPDKLDIRKLKSIENPYEKT